MAIQRSEEIMKKSCGSSLNPTVPGPTLSASTLTNENTPDIIPKPSPTTGKDMNMYILQRFYFYSIGGLYKFPSEFLY